MLNMRINGLFLGALCLGVFLSGTGISLQAETVYGVDATQIVSVNTTTRATTLLFDLSTWAPGGIAWSGQPNELAYDAFAHNLIFSETNGSRIGIFNTSSLTASILMDIDTFSSVTSVVSGGTVDGNMGGGAFFYNDSYYFTVEDIDGTGSQHSRLFRANLNTAHTAITTIGLVTFGGGNPFLGDFGDMAALNNGTVYGSSTRTGTSTGVMYGFWSFNIENPAAGFTTINTGTGSSQLAFSVSGSTLFASQFSSGTLGTINLATGTFTSSGSLSGAATGLTDLTQAFSPVPEPSSALLLVAAIILFFRRRSDAVSRIKITR